MNMNWSTWNAATKASWSIQHLLLWLIWWENLWEKCSNHLTHHCWCNRALAEIVDISVVPSHSKGAGISDICKKSGPWILATRFALKWYRVDIYTQSKGIYNELASKVAHRGNLSARLRWQSPAIQGVLGRRICLDKKSRGELFSLGQSLVADRKTQNWTMRKILPKWIFRLLTHESSMNIWQISHFLGTTNFTWLGVGVSMRLALFGFFIPYYHSFSDAKDLPLTGIESGIVSGSMQLTKSLGLKRNGKPVDRCLEPNLNHFKFVNQKSWLSSLVRKSRERNQNG